MPAAKAAITHTRPVIWRDFNTSAIWAGLTAFVWYAFGAVPLHIAVSQQLHLSAAQTSSWIFIIWFTGAISSVVLSIYYRQPLPITWTIPGLIYLGTLADRFNYAELVGANLIAGVLIVVLGSLGVGARIMRWLPLPIVMGMFAGSILGYVTRLVSATVEDIIVAGSAVAAYLIGRLIANPRIPPVGLAVIAGGAAVYAAERFTPASIAWSLPVVRVVRGSAHDVRGHVSRREAAGLQVKGRGIHQCLLILCRSFLTVSLSYARHAKFRA